MSGKTEMNSPAPVLSEAEIENRLGKMCAVAARLEEIANNEPKQTDRCDLVRFEEGHIWFELCTKFHVELSKEEYEAKTGRIHAIMYDYYKKLEDVPNVYTLKDAAPSNVSREEYDRQCKGVPNPMPYEDWVKRMMARNLVGPKGGTGTPPKAAVLPNRPTYHTAVQVNGKWRGQLVRYDSDAKVVVVWTGSLLCTTVEKAKEDAKDKARECLIESFDAPAGSMLP